MSHNSHMVNRTSKKKFQRNYLGCCDKFIYSTHRSVIEHLLLLVSFLSNEFISSSHSSSELSISPIISSNSYSPSNQTRISMSELVIFLSLLKSKHSPTIYLFFAFSSPQPSSYIILFRCEIFISCERSNRFFFISSPSSKDSRLYFFRTLEMSDIFIYFFCPKIVWKSDRFKACPPPSWRCSISQNRSESIFPLLLISPGTFTVCKIYVMTSMVS